MKNLDSPTLSSTLFKDMDTCRAAVIENERGREKKHREEEENVLVVRENTKGVQHLATVGT